MGRTHAGTCVILLVQDLQTRVINAATGELLRDPTLDPSRDYQPTGASKGPCCKTPKLPVPGLGQPTHGRVPGGGRGCLRTPLTTTQGRLTQGAARRGARSDPPTAQE